MPDWEKIIARQHAAAHSNDEYELVTGDRAAASEIARRGDQLGLIFPEEFVSLYETYNGVGIGSGDDVWWVLHPLDQLSQFGKSVCSFFDETHPEEADLFYPFLDFGNGDAIGYLSDESGNVMPGLYVFSHESVRFDEDQESEEFLSLIPVSIEDFFDSI